MKMTNREVARILEHIADMLQYLDDNPFKIKAYRQAAISIYHLDEDLKYLNEKGCLAEIPGVGQAIRAKIEELIEKGSCEYYNNLLGQVPEGLLGMLAIPGIGPKTIKAVFENLGITSREELLMAARQKKIRSIPGLGSKTEDNIIKGIEMLELQSNQHTLGLLYPLAMELLAYLRGLPLVTECALAGSLRRGKALVKDIDIVAGAQDETRLRNEISQYRKIKQIDISEAGHLAGILEHDIPFEIIIVPPSEFSSGLFWTTGSKPHIAKLIPSLDRSLTNDCQSETEIYSRFNLPYIPPELREDQGEIEAAAAGNLPQLIEVDDLKGDLHTHSSWSDGTSKIYELAEVARSMDYLYLAVTDHSRSLAISGGLNQERLHAQGLEIDRLNELWDDFTLLKGTEVDILKDGSLDFSDDILENLDVVVASIHSNFRLGKEQQTERIIQSMKNENVDIIGHLSGRLLNRRPPYELDVGRILEAAAQNRVILEINSHPDRLDINAEIARQAKEYGIKIAINSDAHHKSDLRLTRYGVLNARRGWLSQEDVINTWSKTALLSFIKNS